MKDILRAGLAVPSLRVADVAFNCQQIKDKISEAKSAGVTLLSFPELSLTGYTCEDLFLSDVLLRAVEAALCDLATTVPDGMLVAVGAPLLVGHHLYNCAVMLGEGRILGAVPKSFLPAHGTAKEGRWFSSAFDMDPAFATAGAFTFPVDSRLIFTAADALSVGVEICEDVLAPLPPSTFLALSGAHIILNLAASPAAVGKHEFVRRTVLEKSASLSAAYLYVSAGADESVADQVFGGNSFMAQGGKLIAESEEGIQSNYLLISDLDMGKVLFDRRHNRTFGDCAERFAPTAEVLPLAFSLAGADGTRLSLRRLPFIPDDAKTRHARSAEILEIQTAALARRLAHTGGKAVLGISGGLDSTLALLVAVLATKRLGLPTANITAVTMPCFGTTDETLGNALDLMKALGVSARTVSIKKAVLQHFEDIGHEKDDFSVVYENAQARERTQVLMDVANQVGGIVLGTGDLSELALGWCTYNGDHMSMYGVNADVPKTLVRWLISYAAETGLFPEATPALLRILDTPISPELLPPDAVGKIAQKTEDLVGPYALHDFFLYYAVRYQYSPSKIFDLAVLAFDGMFDRATIKKWLTVFFKRFFAQQFKRNCAPDGVAIGSVCLSPKGGWSMPSDAFAAEWLREVEAIKA